VNIVCFVLFREFWVGEEYKSKCFIPMCNETLTANGGWHMGHMVASSKGGLTEISNMRPICGSCNSSMGTKSIEEFTSEMGYCPHDMAIGEPERESVLTYSPEVLKFAVHEILWGKARNLTQPVEFRRHSTFFDDLQETVHFRHHLNCTANSLSICVGKLAKDPTCAFITKRDYHVGAKHIKSWVLHPVRSHAYQILKQNQALYGQRRSVAYWDPCPAPTQQHRGNKVVNMPGGGIGGFFYP